MIDGGYLNTKLTSKEILQYYKEHKIRFDKCQLFIDYLGSYLRLIEVTYLGDDVIVDADDREKHCRWVYELNNKGFKKEGHVFGSEDLFKLLMDYTNDFFYFDLDKAKQEGVYNLFTFYLKYDGDKTRFELDQMISVYKTIDEALNAIDL